VIHQRQGLTFRLKASDDRLGIHPGPQDLQGDLSLELLGWVLGCTFVYSALFGTGALLYGQLLQGALCWAVALGSGTWLATVFRKIWLGRRPTASG